jgi:hypothetical protein
MESIRQDHTPVEVCEQLRETSYCEECSMDWLCPAMEMCEQMDRVLRIIRESADCDERGNPSLVDHILWRIQDKEDDGGD